MTKSTSTGQLVPKATDGGWGWMVVAGSFLANVICDGWLISFGVFYPELLEYFHEGKGKTALIGALMHGLPLLIGPVVCALTTVYGCRTATIAGGFVTGLSIILSSFANSVNFLCFSAGVLSSIGMTLTFIPALVIVTFYFEDWRGLATGLAATGFGLGAFAFPILMEHLLDRYAWRGMLLIFGGICFNTIVAGCLFRAPPMGVPDDQDDEFPATTVAVPHIKRSSSNIMMPRLHSREMVRGRSGSVVIRGTVSPVNDPQDCLLLHEVVVPKPLETRGNEHRILQDNPRTIHSVSSPDLYMEHDKQDCEDPEPMSQKCGLRFLSELRILMKSMLDKSLLHNSLFLWYCASGFIMFLWIGVPNVYLVDYALELGISFQKASFLLSYTAVGRTIGMIVLGLVGDVKQVNVVVLRGVCAAICGASTMCLPLLTSYETLAVYAAIFGFFVSVTSVLPMMTLVAIVGLDKSVSAFGVQQFLAGIAVLLGTSVAGWLYDKTQTYDPSFYTSGACFVISGLMLLPAPIMQRRQNRAEK